MKAVITAFAQSPDRGAGQARDMRVRWALEEVGQPYDERLLTFAQMKQPAHLALNPFGQIPTFEAGDLALFESAAIVWHVAQRHAGLLPVEPDGRARALMWMFAAVGTVEPPILEREVALLVEHDQPWTAQRVPLIEARIHQRLGQLSQRLGSAQWLEGAFSAGDLVMVGVLRRLGRSGLLAAHPRLVDYVGRGEARPAFQRAFDAQRAVFLRAGADDPSPPPAAM